MITIILSSELKKLFRQSDERIKSALISWDNYLITTEECDQIIKNEHAYQRKNFKSFIKGKNIKTNTDNPNI